MGRNVSPGDLHRIVVAVFVAAGGPEDLARSVADALVDNQVAGHDSHGVVRIPQYLGAIERGVIDPPARPTVVQEDDTTALVDGAWGFGQAAADLAASVLIDKALRHKVAAVSITRVNHTGRLAVWTERAAREGVVMFMTLGTGAKPLTAPFGGAAAVLGTNPLSFSLPNHDGDAVTLDFATAAIANGKIMVAQAEGQQLPEGVIVTKDGEATTDPADYFAGGFLLPFGGHKGYALSVIADLLGGVVTGAYDDGADPQRTGVFMFGVAHDAFRPSDDYRRAMTTAVDRITSVPPAKGYDEVLVPGMPEARERARRSEELTIGSGTWAQVIEAAQTVGVDVESLLG